MSTKRSNQLSYNPMYVKYYIMRSRKKASLQIRDCPTRLLQLSQEIKRNGGIAEIQFNCTAVLLASGSPIRES